MFSAISFRVLEKDPPSIFNRGSGGLSTFASEIALSRDLKIIYSFSELNRISPEHYALLVIGPDQELYDTEYLDTWISSGGLVIILDELDYSLGLLKSFELGLGDTRSVIDIAMCNVNNMSMPIFVNVFRGIRYLEGDVLCVYNGIPVAVSVEYGKGKIVVVGDSSLCINELASKIPSWYNLNKQFILLISGERKIAIYEGARVYSETTSYLIADVLSILPNVVSDVALFFYEKTFLLRSLFISILAFISTLFIIFKFGLPQRPIHKKVGEHETYKNLKAKIDEGVEAWTKKAKIKKE